MKDRIQKLAIVLFFAMFIYSGINKILNFQEKVDGLREKTGLPYPMNGMGMCGVILLEIFGSLLMIYHFWGGKMIPIEYVEYTCMLFIAFLIVVTLLYHPPWEKIIPFLSNVTTTGGLLFIYNVL